SLPISAVFSCLAGAGMGGGKRLVVPEPNGAVRHGARLEALEDRLDGLDLVERHGLPPFEVEVHQAAQGAEACRLIVDQARVFLKDLEIAGTASVLQLVDGLLIEDRIFPFTTV